MTIDADRLIVNELRHAAKDLIAVYRFGSTVHGTARRDSDTDLAVLAPQRISPEVRFDAQERIAARLGRDVDLVDLAAASPVLAIQIITQGQLLYEGDAAARGLFEDRVFSAYARLNEERRAILERVAAEGTIYGR